MTKNLKIAAIVSAAALLAIGASMTSFAATGWVEEDGVWHYYTKAGDQVTDTWEKSGSNWFYLDSDGTMATDSLIDDNDNYYYVDANGAMVTNQWIQMENEDAGDEDQPDTWWYYFQANGKAYKRSSNGSGVSLKTINGKKYTFDDDGHMQYGWVLKSDGTTNHDDTAWAAESADPEYYFGDENDGAMTIGWREISITDDNADDDSISSQPGDSYWDTDQTRWFYFKPSGQKQTSNTNKSINGKKYGFDDYGRMIASWYSSVANTGSAANTTASYADTFKYFSSPEDGARYTKGWFKVVPGYFLNKGDYDNGEDKWFYATGDGTLAAGKIKTIKGKKYGFKPNGEMIDGLALLQFDDTADYSKISDKLADDGDYPYNSEDAFNATVRGHIESFMGDKPKYAFYYFSADADHDGALKTGTQSLTIDGDKFSFKFHKEGSRKGAGYVGLEDKKYYLGGKLIKAGSDDKVIVLDTNTVDTDYQPADGAEYLTDISTSNYLDYWCGGIEDGAIKVEKATEYTDANGKKFTAKSGYTYWIPEKVTNTAGKLVADDSFVLVNTSGSVVKNSSKKNGEGYTFHATSGSTIGYVEVEN